jgi:hypothetical protein
MAKKRILIKVFFHRYLQPAYTELVNFLHCVFNKVQSSSFAQAAPQLHQVENVIWIALVRGRDFL